MRSSAPDPYARLRLYWPALRGFYWCLYGQLLALDVLRLDGDAGAVRWLTRQVGRLEHYLRGLLIIGCQHLRKHGREARSVVQPRSGRKHLGTASGQTSPRRPGFSLSISAFLPQKEKRVRAFSHSRNAPKAPAPKNEEAAEDASALAVLVERLHLAAAVMRASDAWTARMAAHIDKAGLRVRKAPTQRPSGANEPCLSHAAPQSPFATPLAPDTS